MGPKMAPRWILSDVKFEKIGPGPFLYPQVRGQKNDAENQVENKRVKKSCRTLRVDASRCELTAPSIFKRRACLEQGCTASDGTINL